MVWVSQKTYFWFEISSLSCRRDNGWVSCGRYQTLSIPIGLSPLASAEACKVQIYLFKFPRLFSFNSCNFNYCICRWVHVFNILLILFPRSTDVAKWFYALIDKKKASNSVSWCSWKRLCYEELMVPMVAYGDGEEWFQEIWRYSL